MLKKDRRKIQRKTFIFFNFLSRTDDQYMCDVVRYINATLNLLYCPRKFIPDILAET